MQETWRELRKDCLTIFIEDFFEEICVVNSAVVQHENALNIGIWLHFRKLR
jgi:hypothetical protein